MRFSRTILLGVFSLFACGPSSVATQPDAAPPLDDDASAADDAGAPALPTLTFCGIPNAKDLSSAYTTSTDGSYVRFACAQACSDWTSCATGLVGSAGGPVLSKRGGLQIQVLAFVVDGMGGHFAYTPDGGDVVITHAGAGGTSTLNQFDGYLQSGSNLKTVTLGWEPGTTQIQSGNGGAGWFTRADATPTSVRALAARPAAAIAWVKDHFAQGKKLGTVGSSMGTAATFGAHVWYGLDSILDYQMLIGGPGLWDVNVGCGRVHSALGHCDGDGAPCAGNPTSSYGNDDPSCGSDATNQCRVATIMAPISNSPTGSAYDDIINYVGMTTACTPQSTDTRDPSLDVSSLGLTVTNWSFHGRVDFVANEGGVQPPDADQGMGEGHMLDIYAAIQSAKSWTDNEGQHHGDSFDKIPSLIAASAQKVIAGMQ